MPTGKPTKMKKCSVCGDMFLPEKPSSRICSKDHINHCPICGKEIIWNTTRKIEPCSKECRRKLTIQHNLEKYGTEHPMQNAQVRANHRKAMKEKYGVEYALQSAELKQKAVDSNNARFGYDWALSSREVKEKSYKTMMDRYGGRTTLESKELRAKMEDTMRKKYGHTNCANVPSVRNRIEATNLERYGHVNPMSNPDIAYSSIKTRIEHYGTFWPKEIDDAAKATFLERYGVDNPSKSIELMEKARQVCMERYGVPYGCLLPQNSTKRVSKYNIRIHDLLHDNGIESDFEYYLGGKFYDLHIKDTNTLIELDPTYTHNTIGNHWTDKGLSPDYHINKTKIANEHGYRCIHIFDWDDVDKVVSILAPKKTIFARKCKIYKLNLKTTRDFLNKYHLQGNCRGQLLCLGLVYNDEVFEVMTFGKSRYDKSHTVELLRLCTKSGYTIVGGASRLFKFATEYYGLDNIISYCDLSKFDGSVYEKIGMKRIRTTPPQEVWSRENNKITANLLRARGYDQLFKTNYGKGTSNEQLMFDNGWLPVCDCGQAVYEY